VANIDAYPSYHPPSKDLTEEEGISLSTQLGQPTIVRRFQQHHQRYQRAIALSETEHFDVPITVVGKL